LENSLECHYSKMSGSLATRFQLLPWNGELSLASSGRKPPLITRFKCFWDDKSINFLLECEDSDIRATMTEPNSKVWLEEAVEIFIAPGSHDPRVYYEFQLSPANISRQIKVTNLMEEGNDLTFDDSWRCDGLQTETYVHGCLNDPSRKSEAWEGIFSIPLRCLMGRDHVIHRGDVWRVNLFRIDRWPVQMFCAWSPTFHNPPLFHSPRHFGRLVFS